ncbi:MAG: hypothetical protein HOP18_16630 [Deltaproteobacteria bacterium]|nr:hypothetical protein [Deltaproteobacteria bacterium]
MRKGTLAEVDNRAHGGIIKKIRPTLVALESLQVWDNRAILKRAVPAYSFH